MPRHNPNLATATAAFENLPKGDYTFVIGDAKTFHNKGTNQDGSEKENYGVQYNLRVKGGEKDGKTVVIRHYMHVDTTMGMVKQFMMAALGYALNEVDEAQFNRDYPNADYSFDTDTTELGEMWKKVVGSLVEAAVDIQPQKNNPDRQNQTFRWRPAAK